MLVHRKITSSANAFTVHLLLLFGLFITASSKVAKVHASPIPTNNSSDIVSQSVPSNVGPPAGSKDMVLLGYIRVTRGEEINSGETTWLMQDWISHPDFNLIHPRPLAPQLAGGQRYVTSIYYSACKVFIKLEDLVKIPALYVRREKIIDLWETKTAHELWPDKIVLSLTLQPDFFLRFPIFKLKENDHLLKICDCEPEDELLGTVSSWEIAQWPEYFPVLKEKFTQKTRDRVFKVEV
ncbi:hypothetical protein F5878DRAFT_613349 [Lentinula raphanica]|uniref:Uncharacterized protein n=1 Tax=Lentinula raphanica TaxID=153919 RepID=A0AA38UG95_9AGAR|nr:hypothetical protein F5878DRAFT_613349 [Lentinula raphanica]